jgi:hypothetical protein
MGLLGRKRNEILTTGRETRRTWDPEPSSIHYRSYVWWTQNGGWAPRQENFCHYWRVALIWSPLKRAVQNKLLQIVAGALIGLWVLTSIVIVTSTWTQIALTVVGTLLGIVYIVSGAAMALYHLDTYLEGESEITCLEDRGNGTIALLTLLTLPVLVIGAVFGLIGVMLHSIFEVHELHRQFSELLGRKLSSRVQWLTPLTVLLGLGFAYLVATAWWFESSRNVLMGIAATGVLLAGAAGLSFLSSVVEERRKRQRIAAADAKGILSTKRSSRRRRFRPFRAACSILALIWAILLTKKWGICPFVDVKK